MGAEPRFKGRRNQWPVWCVYLVSPVASLQLASTKHASITAAGGKEPKNSLSLRIISVQLQPLFSCGQGGESGAQGARSPAPKAPARLEKELNTQVRGWRPRAKPVRSHPGLYHPEGLPTPSRDYVGFSNRSGSPFEGCYLDRHFIGAQCQRLPRLAFFNCETLDARQECPELSFRSPCPPPCAAGRWWSLRGERSR